MTQNKTVIDIIQKLRDQSIRVFSNKELSAIIGKSSNTTLFHLVRKGWITNIKNGLYALSNLLLEGQPLHEFEIAIKIVSPSWISHYSAMHYHHLTDQIPFATYLTTSGPLPTINSKKSSSIDLLGHQYNIIQQKEEDRNGIEAVWIGSALIDITDLEKTIIDGLAQPKYCGGLREVLHSLSENIDRLNIEKLISYSKDKSSKKRLGWALDKIGIEMQELIPKDKYYILLNASGEDFGAYNNKWKVRENI
jgi:predicted transcriptional regulator of viral defense system